MASFSDFVSNLTAFNTGVVIPFITGFFTSTIGFCFVAVCVFSVVLIGLARLLRR